MGINGLNKFLRDKFSNVHTQMHLSHYKYKKIAIDISIYMYRYKASFGDRWLSAFVNLIICLRKNNIHCVFIYDTKAPQEKDIERQKRRKQRDDLARSVEQLETLLKNYKENGTTHQMLYDVMAKNQPPRLLNDNTPPTINIQVIEDVLETKKRQVIKITPEDFNLTKQLFDIMKIPYFDAPSEAETMCSNLCITNKVDAVLSEDSDVFAYGTPVFINKININDETCVETKYADVLNEMSFDSEQFLDFCIMCGTDYNDNIKDIGPVKAYELIKEFKNIDGIQHYIDTNSNLTKQLSLCKNNIEKLNHFRVREMFTDYESNDVNVPYCSKPDFDALQLFLVENNCRDIHLQSLRKAFTQTFVIE
jgi:5'-3' exonuclease